MHLETERLVLEEFTMDDLPALWDIFRDEQTMEHMAPMTRAGTEELLRSFCLERTPPGAFAARLREAPSPAGTEIAWVLRRDCWGKGLAGEASRAVLAHAFSALNAHKVIAQTEDIRRAGPLLERLGMVREGVQRRHAQPDDHTAEYPHLQRRYSQNLSHGTIQHPHGLLY